MIAAQKRSCSLWQRPVRVSRTSLCCLFCIWRLSFVLSCFQVHQKGDFSLENFRPVGITEVVFYVRSVVHMEVDDLCLCIQTQISVSVLLKSVPFQKVIKLFNFSPFSNRGVYASSRGIILECRNSYVVSCFQGVTPCCSHLWGHPEKAFGSSSEGYSLHVTEWMTFWMLQVSVSPEHCDLDD